MPVKRITFREAMEWARGREVTEERADSDQVRIAGGQDRVVLAFADGSRIEFRSEYERDYSPDTPGGGIEPPTCWLFTPDGPGGEIAPPAAGG
jgi:hypothetical protein